MISVPMIIRSISSGDASGIFKILASVRAVSKVLIGPTWTFEQLETECRERGLVVETADGQILSFILWRESGDVCEISFLATEPNAQGQGLMSSLIEHLKSARPAKQAIWLEVHAQNHSARALYEKAGFVQTGERPRYYSDGGTAILYNYG